MENKKEEQQHSFDLPPPHTHTHELRKLENQKRSKLSGKCFSLPTFLRFFSFLRFLIGGGDFVVSGRRKKRRKFDAVWFFNSG
jgi:hypothetical protein